MAGITSTVGMATALSFGGGRATGGPVDSGSFYKVGEGNRPELMQTGSGLFAMPGDRGKVMNPSQLGGGGSNVVINIHDYSSEGSQVKQGDDGSVDVIIGKIASQLRTTRALCTKQ